MTAQDAILKGTHKVGQKSKTESKTVADSVSPVKYAKMAATNVNPNEISAPWKFSDVVLVVEDQKFHVHRSTLAYWSPVFEKIFLSDFKEKSNDEIPLPGKKASEIKHLLYMMYPFLGGETIHKEQLLLFV